MVTEENYKDIADKVYAVEDGKDSYTVREEYTFQSNNQKFQVLKAKDNLDNGMQAMAAAPIDDSLEKELREREKRFKRGEIILSSLFIFSYIGLMIGLFSWNGPIIIFISFFTFGLPFLSIIMLKRDKAAVSIGYLSSLTTLFYLLTAFLNFPLKQITDEAGHEAMLSFWESFMVIISIIIFLLISTLLFFYKMSQKRRN
ncbi:hypothetical protein AB3331_05810 [Streptococcus sp. H49]|uniref:hypothetical protein n=1 Tax=Streptococcus huangxiaojuni TaxID=3237239 RepID=UPI0034A44E06